MKMVITIELDEKDLKNLEEIEREETKEKQGETNKDNKEDSYSQYARFFDDGCNVWTKDLEYNLVFLKQQEEYATAKLKMQGYLFLNDVYDMLGIPRTKAGQIVGWIYDEEHPIGDNRVDFGLYDDKRQNRDFINGYTNCIILDFNVDGNILDLI